VFVPIRSKVGAEKCRGEFRCKVRKHERRVPRIVKQRVGQQRECEPYTFFYRVSGGTGARIPKVQVLQVVQPRIDRRGTVVKLLDDSQGRKSAIAGPAGCGGREDRVLKEDEVLDYREERDVEGGEVRLEA
jgi:hypothetical protein